MTAETAIADVLASRHWLLNSSTGPFWSDKIEPPAAEYDIVVNSGLFDELSTLIEAKSAISSSTASELFHITPPVQFAEPNFVTIWSYGSAPPNPSTSFVANTTFVNVISSGAGFSLNAITNPVPIWSLVDALVGKPTEDPFEGFDEYQEANWDGFDADPISRETLEAARLMNKIVPAIFGAPDIAPGADGTIGFEWLPEDEPIVKLYIDVGPGSVWRAYWRQRNGEVGNLPAREITLNTRAIVQQLFKDLSA